MTYRRIVVMHIYLVVKMPLAASKVFSFSLR